MPELIIYKYPHSENIMIWCWCVSSSRCGQQQNVIFLIICFRQPAVVFVVYEVRRRGKRVQYSRWSSAVLNMGLLNALFECVYSYYMRLRALSVQQSAVNVQSMCGRNSQQPRAGRWNAVLSTSLWAVILVCTNNNIHASETKFSTLRETIW